MRGIELDAAKSSKVGGGTLNRIANARMVECQLGAIRMPEWLAATKE
jgi:hypothetical protein